MRVEHRALHRAVELLNGPAALAAELNCTEEQLGRWLQGAPVPARIFLHAVDILDAHSFRDLEEAALRYEASGSRPPSGS
jgi:hypothetical protein